MGSGPGRPVKTHGPPHGPGGATHIEPTSHGPRPGPAHQISRGWAAAQPGPSNFQRLGRGPARPIEISEDGPRPGPAHNIFKNSRSGPDHHFFKSLGTARPGPSQAHETRALYGPARQLRGPARGFDGLAHGPTHVLSRSKKCMCIRWRYLLT